MPVNTKLCTIVFLCLARNVEQYIDRTVNNIEAIASHFKDYRVLFFENNSSDNTKEKLKHLPNNKYTAISDDSFAAHYPLRTHRIAAARNRLNEELQKLDIQIDYVVPVDSDDVTQYVDTKGFLSCFEIDGWDGVFPIWGHDGYYDLWALRLGKFNYNSMDAINFEAMKRYGKTLWYLSLEESKAFPQTYLAKHPDVLNLLERIKKKELIEVSSAFGGMGIYTYSAFILGHYDGRNLNPYYKYIGDSFVWSIDEEGEHVPFHESIRTALKSQGKNFRLIINPEFKVCNQPLE